MAKSKHWIVSILTGKSHDVARVNFSEPRTKAEAKEAYLARIARERGTDAVKGADINAQPTEGYFK